MYPDYDSPRLTGPYLDIHTERAAQKGRLGAEHHILQEWLLVLVENMGRIAEAVLTAGSDDVHPEARLADVRQEGVQTGAAVIALLEHLDSLESIPT
ncbi:hypothetical protein [Streptomyces prunicolor]|uniref:hypothetical protein n=1 Tax=Streptomyces prunicolor TaxID=67348 RepID=UPI00035F317E|nr:hypothetical protein [Streptomyces prunicolor]